MLVFVPYVQDAAAGVAALFAGCEVVFMAAPGSLLPPGYEHVECAEGVASTSTLLAIGERVAASASRCVLLYTKTDALQPGYGAVDRLQSIMEQTGAGMLYADYVEVNSQGERRDCPVLDLQPGALRDDFNFGPLLAFGRDAFLKGLSTLTPGLKAAALYELRLYLMRETKIVHVNEKLYACIERDNRKSGEKNFDYVDPRNRDSQVEMEKVCTRHLKAIGAWLPPHRDDTDLDAGEFAVEASVIIPVKNRRRTIGQAIESVLAQKTSFPFNIIVIDNHSTDGTTELVARYAAADSRVVHLIPPRTDLGIGGCWNYGAADAACGRFALQLDSDDVYSNPNVVQYIVDEFRRQKCAMLIGSYQLTDFEGNPLPPGVIDHKEWTDSNGPNNALRINGLGAPRCFFTPVLRANPLPNVSYGEDYAAALAISRKYRIGRIYDVLYLCRRWEGNSDASLNIEQQNRNNHYKDSVRTQEIMARMALNAQ